MALPPQLATRTRRRAPVYGIRVAIFPSTETKFDAELERKTGSTASTQNFDLIRKFTYNDIQSLTSTGNTFAYVYTDILPNDGTAFTYRARAVGIGYFGSTYTGQVTAKPVQLAL